jgi:hypothetical protein
MEGEEFYENGYECNGVEIGKIGAWTGKVPPAALDKRRQE